MYSNSMTNCYSNFWLFAAKKPLPEKGAKRFRSYLDSVKRCARTRACVCVCVCTSLKYRYSTMATQKAWYSNTDKSSFERALEGGIAGAMTVHTKMLYSGTKRTSSAYIFAPGTSPFCVVWRDENHLRPAIVREFFLCRCDDERAFGGLES